MSFILINVSVSSELAKVAAVKQNEDFYEQFLLATEANNIPRVTKTHYGMGYELRMEKAASERLTNTRNVQRPSRPDRPRPSRPERPHRPERPNRPGR